MAGQIKPRYGFQTFEPSAKGWAQAKNREACKLDAVTFPSYDQIGPLPEFGTSAGQQWIDSEDNSLNTWDGSTWFRCPATKGMVAHDCERNLFTFFNGTDWVDLLTADALRDVLEANLNLFYAFSSGNGAPTEPPTFNFPFYQDLDTSDIYIYNFNNGQWLPLSNPSAVVSAGAESSGVFPIGDANGLIDSSWLSFVDNTTGLISCDFIEDKTEDNYTQVGSDFTSLPSNQTVEVNFPDFSNSDISKSGAGGYDILSAGRYDIRFTANSFHNPAEWGEYIAFLTVSGFGSISGPASLVGQGQQSVNSTQLGSQVSIVADLAVGDNILTRVRYTNQTGTSGTISNAFISITKIKDL